MLKMYGEVIATRPSLSRSGQDRVKLRIGDTNENIVRIYVPTGKYAVGDQIKLKLSLDGSRAYRDVPTTSTVIKNPS